MFSSLGLNLCKCLDMMLTISDPFFPAHRRMKWYYLLSIVIAFSFTFLSLGEGIGIQKDPSEKDDTPDSNTVFEAAFTVSVISVFFILAIYSSVKALRLTTRPGISRTIRKHYSYSHMKYIFVYSLSWLCYYFAAYYLMFYTALFGNNF
jgi:hypothetical protein